MNRLKVAYFGTPYFSARFLGKLMTDTSLKHLIEVKLVVTQPDKPVGKKQKLTKSPVKVVAEKYSIKILDIENLKLIGNWKLEIGNLDLAFLYAYGRVIPKELLSIPKYGFWNTHPSLLPKYRGALPIAFPLIVGDKKTGVTLIQLDDQIDHGPIIAQEEMKINPNDRRPDLEIKLTDLAFKLFKRTINLLASSRVNELKKIFKPQNHNQATLTKQLKKDDGFLPFSTLQKALNNQPLTFKELPKLISEYLTKYDLISNWNPPAGGSPKIIYNFFRGLYSWPGLWTLIKINKLEKRLKLTDLTINNEQLTINRVQLEGKKEVNFETFNRAYKIFKYHDFPFKKPAIIT